MTVIFFFIVYYIYPQSKTMSKVVNESSLLFLNTKDSVSPSTPYNTTFVLNGSVVSNFDDYSLTFQSMEIPNLRYPVNRFNDVVYFKENGGATITTSLTNQTYTGTELAVELASKLTASSGVAETYTGTYNQQTKKITITAGGFTGLSFVDGDNNSNTVTGFAAGPILLGGGTATYTVRLDGTSYIDVITNISTDNYSSDKKSNVLFRIPMLQPFGSIVYISNPTDDFLSISTDSIQTLDIRLIDDQGNIFELPSNCNISMTLKLIPIY